MIVAGLDVGFSGDFMALVIVEESGDKIRLVHLATWRGFEWHQWKLDMKLKQEKFDIYKIFVDKTSNQTVEYELNDIGMRAEGVLFTHSKKEDMIRNMTSLISSRKLVMPKLSRVISIKQKEILSELLAQIREQEYTHTTSNPKLGHPVGRHDDLLWALCLALYGMVHQTPVEPMIMSFDHDDIPYNDRFGSGLTGYKVTDFKIKMPGEW